MRIKVEKGVVTFYVDESSPSCGENRADWKFIGKCSMKNIVDLFLSAIRKQQTVRLDI